MSTATGSTSNPVTKWARRQAEAYRDGEDRPLGGYLAAMSVYGASVAALALAGRLRGRNLPAEISVQDIALLAVATHRLSRTIAKDPVTSPLRAPFTRYDGVSAAAELHEQVRSDSGVQHAVGELISCPMCLAQWIATGFTAGLVLAPRATRLAMTAMAGVAGSDFLQYVYSALQQQTEK